MAHLGGIVFGAIWISIGILLIFALINVNYLNAMADEPPSLQLPSDVPNNMPLCTNESALKVSDASAFIALGQPSKIEFESISSLQGLCGGTNASLSVTSHNLTLPAEAPAASWHGDLENKMYTATPYLHVTVQSQELVHQWITGKAFMDAIYPVESTPKVGIYWTNEYKPVERDFNFYVLTQDEANILVTHNAWQHEVDRRSNALWWGIPISLFVFVILGGLLVRYSYRQRKKDSARKLRPYYRSYF